MSHSDELLEQLLSTRRSALVGYAFVLTGDVASAEDLVHEALVRAFVKDRGLSGLAHAEGYVRRAIATTFLNSRRKHRRFVAKMHLLTAEEVAADVAVTVTDNDAVTRALQALTPRERACVVLHHMDQMRVREVAEQLGLAQGTVKRYLSDGVAKLEAILGPLQGLDQAADAVETVVVKSAASRRRAL